MAYDGGGASDYGYGYYDMFEGYMNMWRRMVMAGGCSVYLWNGNLDMDSIKGEVSCRLVTFDPWFDI